VDWLIKAVATALISYLVPWLLKRVLPEPGGGSSRTVGDVRRFPWGGWILALAAAGGLSGIVSGLMGLILGGVANWAVLGAMLGIVQWLFLYGRFDIGPWFALASTLGWATFVFIQPVGHLTWAIVGVIVGLLQWLGMQRRIPAAFWWVPANALAWFVAGMTGLAVSMVVAAATNFGIGWIVGWTCVGGVGAVILAIPLNWMFKHDHGARKAAAHPQEGQ